MKETLGKTGDAQITQQGHTTNRSNGSNVNAKATSRPDATHLSK